MSAANLPMPGWHTPGVREFASSIGVKNAHDWDVYLKDISREVLLSRVLTKINNRPIIMNLEDIT